MRVLLLSSEYPPRIGGVASHAAHLAGALARLGHQVTVLAPGSGPDLDGNPAVLRLRHPRFQPLYDLLLRRRLARLNARTSFDVIHVHGLRPLAAALASGVPVVFTNHTSGFLERVQKGRYHALTALLGRLRYLIAPSEELLESARQAGYRGAGEYIPNGVDVQRFTPGSGADLRRQWQITDGEIVVLTARRMVPKNGVITVALAAPLLRDTSCRFIFAGDGPERDRVRAGFDAAGLAGRTIFAGSVSNDAMPGYYRAADFCLLPSLMEATSIAGLEAMACGRALVGTRVGGIPAIIAAGETGLLVPPGDAESLAAAIRRLAGDAALRERLGQAARERAQREFAWEKIAARTAVILEAAAKSAAR